MTPRAIVVGGSMGGLFAAHLLRRAGWAVEVYERARELSGRGAGIVTHQGLFDALAACGLPVTDIGVEVSGRVTYNQDGTAAGRLSLRQILTSWDRLHNVLRGAWPDAHYHAGKELTAIEQHGARVTAGFGDGSRAEGDLLVAADGFRSTARGLLAPEATPAYAGYVAWRGLVDENRISPATHRDLFGYFGFCLPPQEQMLGYPVAGPNNAMGPGERRYNFVWYRPADTAGLSRLLTDRTGREHETSISPALIDPRVVAEMRAAAESLLCRQFAEIVALTAEPFIQPIYDLTSRRMVFGRVALVGDAAFVARPHVGMGVTKAAADAVALRDALAGAGDTDSGLRTFEAGRLKAGHRIIERARHLGAYMQAQVKTAAERRHAESYRTPAAVMAETATADFLQRA